MEDIPMTVGVALGNAHGLLQNLLDQKGGGYPDQIETVNNLIQAIRRLRTDSPRSMWLEL